MQAGLRASVCRKRMAVRSVQSTNPDAAPPCPAQEHTHDTHAYCWPFVTGHPLEPHSPTHYGAVRHTFSAAANEAQLLKLSSTVTALGGPRS